jgi:hypothetical protein
MLSDEITAREEKTSKGDCGLDDGSIDSFFGGRCDLVISLLSDKGFIHMRHDNIFISYCLGRLFFYSSGLLSNFGRYLDFLLLSDGFFACGLRFYSLNGFGDRLGTDKFKWCDLFGYMSCLDLSLHSEFLN